ncbi:protein YecV [Shigella sonnei]|uniref:Protein YecV n=4 Tax=Escherichia coli TaxID=562 RepID=YECV_ECOLI|nr:MULTISPECIES: protein YecV [Bacteria]YP_010051188.1 protein YecV [Escherichia coli str. K-12 substr. MG1655]P0DSF6.1 RecName: Full=Protein YecV [Escherichia coli K-12]MBU5561827.1 protein YecV [Escherichia sp. S69_ASV_4]MBY7621325.1 protein YecV [Escherichia marmotae]MCC2205174.1 protein YecV [Shigella sp. CLA-AA-H239]MCQ8846334.1 protein YecV [Klebsiella sp. KJ_S1]MEB6033650.1 protein YecV [Escherichia coli S88]MEC5349808.1 protein YecV [Serratia liquefaciens]
MSIFRIHLDGNKKA